MAAPPRIHTPQPLATGATVELTEVVSRHLLAVLRLRPGAEVILFDGRGGEYRARLVAGEKRRARLEVGEHRIIERESPLRIELAQGISKGERMDYAIQKAVELGVWRIRPLFTRRSVVKLTGERLEKKRRHWQGVAIAACEQCGRNRIPEVLEPLSLEAWLAEAGRPRRGAILDPTGAIPLATCDPATEPFALLVGPEGGFTGQEVAALSRQGLDRVTLGPRILRTETAAAAALALLQGCRGDLSAG